MVVLKLLGLFLIILALMALGFDALHSFELGQIEIRSLSEISTLLAPGPYEGFAEWTKTALPTGFIPARNAILESYPAWLVLAVPAIVLAVLVKVIDR